MSVILIDLINNSLTIEVGSLVITWIELNLIDIYRQTKRFFNWHLKIIIYY